MKISTRVAKFNCCEDTGVATEVSAPEVQVTPKVSSVTKRILNVNVTASSSLHEKIANEISFLENFRLNPSQQTISEDQKIYTKMYDTIEKDMGGTNKEMEWKDNVPFPEFTVLVAKEAKSVSFFIRYVCASLWVKEGVNVKLTYKGRDDQIELDKFTLTTDSETSRRAIAGFGPSGCGKSTTAETIFKCMELAVVAQVDGGTVRDISIPYQIIAMLGNVHKVGYKKLEDTFKAYAMSKTYIEKFLDKCDTSKKVSYYFPETLGKVRCSRFFRNDSGCIDTSMKNPISKYAALDPKWVAMLIYQHCSLEGKCKGFKCSLNDEKFKCIGCDKSGTVRSVTEGKIYSDAQYVTSMTNGYHLVKNHSGPKIIIHNCGRAEGKSLLGYAGFQGDTLKFVACLNVAPNFVVNAIEKELYSVDYKSFDKVFCEKTSPEESVSSAIGGRKNKTVRRKKLVFKTKKN